MPLRWFLLALWAVFLVVQSFGAAADTRLVEAAIRNDMAAVRSLVAAHAEVNGRSEDGSSALHWAVCNF